MFRGTAKSMRNSGLPFRASTASLYADIPIRGMGEKLAAIIMSNFSSRKLIRRSSLLGFNADFLGEKVGIFAFAACDRHIFRAPDE